MNNPKFTTALILVASLAYQGEGRAQSSSAADESATSPSSERANAADLTLRDAYKREFAFLAGQKRQLSRRLDQVKKQADRDQQQLQQQIARLEAKLLAVEEGNQNLRDALSQAEQAEQSSIDDDQLVDATLDQSLTTLTDYDVEVPEVTEDSDRGTLISQRFAEGVKLLDRLSSVYTEQGEFFAADGTKTEGDVVRVGRIAAYGVSGDAAGALAPAGGGKMKIWKDDAEATARALVSGDSPDMLSIFLFESLDAQVDDAEGETAIEHVDSGGAIAWVIVSLGLFGMLLVLIRAFLLTQATTNTSQLEQSVGSMVQSGKYKDAIDYARRAKGAAARVVASVLPSLEKGQEDIDDIVSESLLSENRRINRFGAVILVIAAVAPLLGLLGTVTGMISTFDIITKYGTGDPKMLSGGISTALVTTELGLIVAIPTLLLGNLLRGWGDGIETDVERVVLRVVNVHKDAREARATTDGGTSAPL